jgi:hypothetical protein
MFTVLGWLLLSRTRFGMHTYVIGVRGPQPRRERLPKAEHPCPSRRERAIRPATLA